MKLIDVSIMARELMIKHKIAQKGWQFDFDNSKVRFGCCNHTHKLITMSRHIARMNDEKPIRNNLLHEIAHAIAGAGMGHGSVWKAQARAIGCTAMRCYDSTVVVTPTRKWIGTCPECGSEIKRHRRYSGLACGSCCSGKYNEKFIFQWRKL